MSSGFSDSDSESGNNFEEMLFKEEVKKIQSIPEKQKQELVQFYTFNDTQIKQEAIQRIQTIFNIKHNKIAEEIINLIYNDLYNKKLEEYRIYFENKYPNKKFKGKSTETKTKVNKLVRKYLMGVVYNHFGIEKQLEIITDEKVSNSVTLKPDVCVKCESSDIYRDKNNIICMACGNIEDKPLEGMSYAQVGGVRGFYKGDKFAQKEKLSPIEVQVNKIKKYISETFGEENIENILSIFNKKIINEPDVKLLGELAIYSIFDVMYENFYNIENNFDYEKFNELITHFVKSRKNRKKYKEYIDNLKLKQLNKTLGKTFDDYFDDIQEIDDFNKLKEILKGKCMLNITDELTKEQMAYLYLWTKKINNTLDENEGDIQTKFEINPLNFRQVKTLFVKNQQCIKTQLFKNRYARFFNFLPK